jgi:ACS family sodium-dependent inorganic phosphate cotransporter
MTDTSLPRPSGSNQDMIVETSGSGGFWKRRFTIIAMCASGMFLCYVDRVNISVAALAMQKDLGWSETTKGWVLSSFFVGYILLQVPSGWLANRFGGKRVMACAVLLWSLFTLLTPWAAAISLPMLIAARIALGASEAATYPAIYNIYGRWVPPSERGRAVALLSGAIPAGTLFALVVTGWMLGFLQWPHVFHIFGIAGFAWFILWYLTVSNDPATDRRIGADERRFLEEVMPAPRGKAPVPWRALFREPAIWALIYNHFCSNWGFYMLLAWLPSYFNSALGISMSGAGAYSAAPWLTMFIVGIISGVVVDKLFARGVRTIVLRKTFQITGLVGSSIFLVLASQATTAPLAVALMCGALGFLAFTLVGFVPNYLDIAPRYADVLVGITNVLGTLPGIVGIVVTGWLVDKTGSYASAFILAAGIHLSGAVIWALFAKAEPVVD